MSLGAGAACGKEVQGLWLAPAFSPGGGTPGGAETWTAHLDHSPAWSPGHGTS